MEKVPESPEVIDFRGDQSAYGEMVAQINRQQAEGLSAQSVPEDGQVMTNALYAVLCRTYGGEIDFSYYDPVYIIAGPSDCYTLYFRSLSDADAAAAALSARPDIRYAETDDSVEACGEGNISFQSWGAETMQYGLYLDYASGCPVVSVTVAVIDSGVFLHSMYAARVTASGYDYVDGDYDATNDLMGHGTNVAGIIADCTQGFPVYFYPIRILNASGNGSISNTVNAIREAVQKGVDVINLSLEAKSISEALDEAVMDALSAGVTVVAAAGNYAMDTVQISPAHIDAAGVIIVGAADSSDNRASYSNFGSSVDLYAYGNDIACCSRSGGYTTATGTSIAAPHITGLAAILRSFHAPIAPEDIEVRIKNAYDPESGGITPRLARITPKDPGFSLTFLRMDMDDRIQLLTQIKPFTAMEPIEYHSDHENVAVVQNGWLTPVGPGEATISADCLGLPAIRFTVRILDPETGCQALVIPHNAEIKPEAFSGCAKIIHAVIQEGVETIGDRAFDSCDSLMTVDIPDSVISIGADPFSDAVIFCSEDSAAEEYVKNNHLQYITRIN